MSVLVIGQGAVGRAFIVGLTARGIPTKGIGARSNWSPPYDHDVAIYAAGPAGEVACREHPYAAFAQHYEEAVEVAEWVSETPGTRLVLIGTTTPNVGFYGALKQLAFDHARESVLASQRSGAILALRCGQIIGPEMPVDGTGVVATWVRQAVRGEPLRVDDPTGTLDVTLCTDLIDRIATWLAAPITSPWEEERICLPDPIPLPALARVCGLASRLATGAATDPAAHVVDPSGTRVPFEVLAAVHGMADNARRAAVSA